MALHKELPRPRECRSRRRTYLRRGEGRLPNSASLPCTASINVRLLHKMLSGAIISSSARTNLPRAARGCQRYLGKTPRAASDLPPTIHESPDDRADRRSPAPPIPCSPTRSARWRWTRWKQRRAAIRACRWAWPRSPSRCGTDTLRTTPPIPAGPNRDRFVRLERPRLDAAVRAAAPHRLRPADGGDQALPAAAFEDAGPPGARRSRPASRRRPARSGRASPTPSAWRSPRRCSPPSSTGPATRSSITAPTCSSATAA